MKKALRIGWKDLILAFRDRAALILMLAAPFVLSLGLGFVTGRFSGSVGSAVSDIPVALVNQDTGDVGRALVDLFQSEDLAPLVAVTVLDNPVTARQQVDQDQVAAAVVIPPAFSASVMQAPGSAGRAPAIELYINPGRPTSAGVIKTIVDGFAARIEVGRAAGQVTATQLVARGLISVQEAPQVGAEVGARLATSSASHPSIVLTGVEGSGAAVQFDPLAYMAPGLALMFLMFTVSNGGRSLLAERAQGTLPRLLVSPTSTAQVLGGKALGTYLTGVAQMLVLIGSMTLLFALRWGDPLAVLVLVLAAVVGAVGWGALLTAVARTPNQVSVIGSALMLTFGILGGSFVSMDMMPGWLAVLSKITPNAWGVDAFLTLALGGGLVDILVPVGALLTMGALLFGVAALLFSRRGISR